MITKIGNISNAGIFQNYTPQGVPDFNRYNLIYGWNGSGKSTLAKLLRHLENREKIEHLEELKYKFEITGQNVTEEGDVPEIIKVFNQDFIRKHLSFESADAQSIVYIGQEKVELKEKANKLNEDIAAQRERYNEITQKVKKLADDKNKWFSAVGGELSRYHSTTVFSAEAKNINKVHAESIWKEIRQGDSLGQFTITDRKFNELNSFIQQGNARKNFIKVEQVLEQKYLEDAYTRFCDLLQVRPVINTIQRLAENPEIQRWVQHGLKIHKDHTSLKCEYCGQGMPAPRQKELEAHFNEEFNLLQQNIRSFIDELRTKFTQPLTYNMTDIPEAQRQAFEVHYNMYLSAIEELNTGLEEWIKKLQYKLANPLETRFSTQNIVVSSFDMAKEWINAFIVLYNKSFDEFEKISSEHRRSLDFHLVATKAREENFMGLIQDLEVASAEQAATVERGKALKEELKAVQIELSDDTLVIGEFNNDLHKFMQRNEIILTKKAEGGGYVLERNGLPAKNLSEGEKSAISLVYFMKKLTENDNKLDNSIIVFDDPISSFDSNHLFTASSFIMSNCKGAKQLFILTHNFWFFKLIRDWYKKRCKNKYALYSISKGNISKAEPALENHHSEYHYMFSSVQKWANSDVVAWQDNYSIANHCRRLLESFNAFKTPSRDGFNDILQRGENKGFSKDTLNMLMFFLNKYSHLDRIETHENAIENIQGEGKNVAIGTLKLVEFLDAEHHEAMVKLCVEEEPEGTQPVA